MVIEHKLRWAFAAAMVLLVGAVVASSGHTRAASPSVVAESASSRPASHSQRLAQPVNLQTNLQHSSSARAGGMVDWRTAWVLKWDDVPAADGYVIRFSTSEGRGGQERRADAATLRVDVAAGTSTSTRVDLDRAAQLTLTASQLLVSVAATDASGAEGPPSAWYRVGEVTANGVPVANAGPADH